MSKENTLYRLKMWHVIHLVKAVERIPLINDINNKMGPITIFNGLSGNDWVNDAANAQRHPLHGMIRAGDVGCTRSHIQIISDACHDESVGIFEDDCEIFDGATARAYLAKVQADYPTADIILLGASEYVSATPLGDYKKVERFWGTHAVLVRRKAFDAILKTYTDGLAVGTFYPADWLYNKAIESNRLFVVGPAAPKQFCQQMLGLRSAITGIVRQ